MKLKSFISSFTPEGDYLAILAPDGVVKIWNTNSGSLLAEWKKSDGDCDFGFSHLACSFVGKKRRKERATLLVVLGSYSGDVLGVDIYSGKMKWKYQGCNPGIAGLSFANRGRSLYVVANNGMASEMASETGELVRDFKVSKLPLSTSAYSSDEKMLAVVSTEIQVFNLETQKKLLKFSSDLGPAENISMSDEAKAIITSGSGLKHLQVWKCDLSTKTVSKGPVLSMRHPPILFECKNGYNEEGGLVIISVSESGIAYVWNLKSISQEETNPTKVTVKANQVNVETQNGGSARKNRIPIIAARLHALEKDGRVNALIAYGSIESPQFTFLDICKPGEEIVITARDESIETTTKTVQENVVLVGKGPSKFESEAAPVQNKRSNKKRAKSDMDLVEMENSVDTGHGETMDEVQVDDDLNEPTMGEKLASLSFLDKTEVKSPEKHESSPPMKPPSADSVHVLLKQALQADDRALLLNCFLHTRNEKVIANSVALLNLSDVLKLLDSLVSAIQSRGAVAVSALPWLRGILLQHASGIISQESSLLALNSFYQMIESRVSTFHSALQLSSCMDLLFAGIVDDDLDKNDTITPIIYEDKDESDEEESGDAMETDDGDNSDHCVTDIGDIEESDGMST